VSDRGTRGGCGMKGGGWMWKGRRGKRGKRRERGRGVGDGIARARDEVEVGDKCTWGRGGKGGRGEGGMEMEEICGGRG